jgi:hypothetical protein
MALVGHISGSTQSNSVIGVSGSVIVANRPQALFPSMPGTDTTFFVSGSTDGTGRSVFGGDLISSGSFNLKTGTGGASQFSVSSTGMLVNTTAGANTFQIAAATGNVTTSGDIAVNGGDITTTSASATLFNSNATAVSIASSATAVTIGSAAGTGTTTINNSLSGKGTNNNIDMLNITGSAGLSVTKNVVISGDLTVNGSMVTVNTTNLEVKDSVIGLGFASGTIAQTAGDRGWIGGLAGTNNVMSKWDNAASEFAFATTTSSATGSFGITAYSNLHAANIQGSIISASLGFSGSHTKLIDGTSAFIGGAGVSITSQSNGAVTISTTGASTVAGSDTWVQYNNGGAFGANADFTFSNSSKQLRVSGSFIQGDANLALGAFSHAEGSGSTAYAAYSHTEGNATITRGLYSHAEGSSTEALGVASHTEGNGTIASGSYQLVIGQFNKRDNSNSVFVIGNGAADNNFFRSDVLRVEPGSYNTGGRLEVTGSIAATLGLSGSLTKLVDGTSAFVAGTGITIASSSNGAVTISTAAGGGDVTGPGSSTQYAVALFNDTTGKVIRNSALTTDGAGSLWISGTLGVSGSTTFGASAVPSADMVYNLGSPSLRWANVYTGDLHLRNDRGDYTLIEEEDFLTIRFNKTGKRYKFLLERVPELDEDPILSFK